MVKYIILFLFAITCSAKTIKVAVVDTGIDTSNKTFKLCPSESKDFTNSKEGIKDINGHGTHVASIIQQYAGDVDYCFVIIKYYKDRSSGAINLERSIKALKYAFNLKVDYINYSGGGDWENEEEAKLIRTHKDTIIITALGNEKKDLSLFCNYYPACYNYPNVIRVGNITRRETRNSSSNWYYNKVDFWSMGEYVKAKWMDGAEHYMSGTSQAAAKVTGLFVSGKRNSLLYNGLTVKEEPFYGQVLEIIECQKWHDRCNILSK